MGQHVQFKCMLLISLLTLSGVYGYETYGLSDEYYAESCPDAESVIRTAVRAELEKNLKLAAGVIRMQFHDCFVQGCDGSVLLDGPDTEKQAPVNAKLAGFEVIDAAKTAVEEICPGVVSCADILAYAARDSTVRLNGSSWNVQGGRKDGFSSSAEQAEADIPVPEFEVSQLIDSFAARGLSAEQMVILSGSHTVGVGHCDKIVGRLYNFNDQDFTDPTIDPAYADELKQFCPQNTYNTSIEILMDVFTPADFDSEYYNTLEANKGLFTSDQSLYLDDRTQATVNSLMENGEFQTQFGNAMRVLAAVGVKYGVEGEIRTKCRSVN